jgi:hypothetical protein
MAHNMILDEDGKRYEIAGNIDMTPGAAVYLVDENTVTFDPNYGGQSRNVAGDWRTAGEVFPEVYDAVAEKLAMIGASAPLSAPTLAAYQEMVRRDLQCAAENSGLPKITVDRDQPQLDKGIVSATVTVQPWAKPIADKFIRECGAEYRNKINDMITRALTGHTEPGDPTIEWETPYTITAKRMTLPVACDSVLFHEGCVSGDASVLRPVLAKDAALVAKYDAWIAAGHAVREHIHSRREDVADDVKKGD